MKYDIFPQIEPYHIQQLKVSDLHTLYLEESGNPRGLPVVFLHGGPGAGTSPKHRQFFDPQFYRIILFDQRGAGKSTPPGETRENTVQNLVADMESIREHSGIERWLIFGGSWGSTLAMAYGVAHPDRCLGFILRGVFLMRDFEIDWFLKGVRIFFPELASLQQSAPAEFEQHIMTLLPSTQLKFDPKQTELISKIEEHYFKNQRHELMGLLDRLKAIAHLPCTIVQGRYDMVCPPITAYEVHQAWPGSKLVMVPDGGHSASDPGMTSALVQATEAARFNLS